MRYQYTGKVENIVRSFGVTGTDWDGEGAVYSLEMTRADFEILQNLVVQNPIWLYLLFFPQVDYRKKEFCLTATNATQTQFFLSLVFFLC